MFLIPCRATPGRHFARTAPRIRLPSNGRAAPAPLLEIVLRREAQSRERLLATPAANWGPWRRREKARHRAAVIPATLDSASHRLSISLRACRTPYNPARQNGSASYPANPQRARLLVAPSGI